MLYCRREAMRIMKEAPYTTAPIVAKQNGQGALKRLLLGHAAPDAYYEARDDAQRRYLWMEVSRFGTLRAYPCALTDGDETLIYRRYEDNSALLERWQTYITEKTVLTLQITELTKDDFRRIYRACRGEDNAPDDRQT